MGYSLVVYYSLLRRGQAGEIQYISEHKFGHNAAVSTSYEPVSNGGIYRTPQVSGATALRIKAGNVNDTAAGSGAQEITLVGLDQTGAEITSVLATAGTSASSATSETFIRLYRAFISGSGTYATQSVGSHAADIVIENAAGSEDWATIELGGFAEGQTEIAAYTVPLGFTGYIRNIHVSADSNKAASIYGFKREGILETSPPYPAMRTWEQFHGILGEESIVPIHPFGPFPELTDVGFLANVGAQTGEVDVDFEIELFKT